MKNTIIMTATVSAIIAVSSFSAFADQGFTTKQITESKIIDICGPALTKSDSFEDAAKYDACAKEVERRNSIKSNN